MCRYIDHNYRTHYACLGCRFTAKHHQRPDVRCPHCRSQMVDMGKDFAAPRKADRKGWERLTALVAKHGARLFDSCGCGPTAIRRSYAR